MREASESEGDLKLRGTEISPEESTKAVSVELE